MVVDPFRVLVVDDNAPMRALVRLLVEEAGHAVVAEAADGVAAIELTAAHAPDCVVMDWSMPRLDGVAATRAIRARWPGTAVIAFSSAADPGVADAFAEAGAAVYVYKGRPDELVAALQRLGGTRAAGRPPTRPALEIDVSRRPALARTQIVLRGALLAAGGEQLVTHVEQHVEPGATIVVDLADITGIDHCGAAALERCGRLAAGAGAALRLQDPSSVVRRALRG